MARSGEDRYHATAIEADEHLHRCLVYIDLNMVRANMVDHPRAWAHSGYREIQQPAERYAIIDRRTLCALCGFPELGDFQRPIASGRSRRFWRSGHGETIAGRSDRRREFGVCRERQKRARQQSGASRIRDEPARMRSGSQVNLTLANPPAKLTL